MIFVVTYVCVCHVYAGVSFCIQMKWVGYIVCSTFRYPSIGPYWSSVLTSIRIGTKCLLTYTRSCTIRYFYQINEQNIYHTVWTVPKYIPHCLNSSTIQRKNLRKRQNWYPLHTNTWPLTVLVWSILLL